MASFGTAQISGMTSADSKIRKARDQTLLPTDKMVANLAIIIPLVLMATAQFLSSSAFKASSLLCTKEFFYVTPNHTDVANHFDHSSEDSKNMCYAQFEGFEKVDFGGSLDNFEGSGIEDAYDGRTKYRRWGLCRTFLDLYAVRI